MSDERESERIREINNLRYKWHRSLIADPELHRCAAALALAGLILWRFHAKLGYAEISAGYASVKLGIPLSTIHRARRLLLRRGWITVWTSPRKRERRLPDMPQRYTLAGGPEDLILDEVASVTHDTHATDDIPT